jgi:hypothetical protein
MDAPAAELDQLQIAYKAAVDEWVATIREEEALASTEHSVADLDKWEAAGFAKKKPTKRPKLPSSSTKEPCARSSSASDLSAVRLS